MRERPILFSAPMVRGLLEDRKTQTRRALKASQRYDALLPSEKHPEEWVPWIGGEPHHSLFCPYGVPGDLLWVRETWSATFWTPEDIDGSPRELWATPRAERTKDLCADRYYRASEEAKEHSLRFLPEGQWSASSHMPRWASRITLLVTDVRVERLNEISEADAIAEGVEQRLVVCADSAGRNLWFGVPHAGHESAVQAYADLWDSINNPRGYCGEDEPHGWDANPWVWAVSFERTPPPDPQVPDDRSRDDIESNQGDVT